MSGFPPSVSDFKTLFTRDFVYGGTTGGLDTVLDSDIQRGITEAQMVFNSGLWASLSDANLACCYVAAHFMVLNIQGAGGLAVKNRGLGVQSKGGGTIESKGVGSVNVGFAVPNYVRESPILSQFMRTDYGQFYLQLLTPRLVGNIAVVSGSVPQSFAGNVSSLVIETTALPDGTHAVPYSQTLAASGGIEPLVWTLDSGSLPTSLSLNAATGTISGTPSLAGTYYFGIRVTDPRGQTAVQNYQVVIA